MRQIITFLGTVIKPTTYRLGETDYTGCVFAEALRQFVTFDRMLVCTTPRARETTWPFLEALDDPRIERLDIETGRDPDELWSIFDALTGAVNVGDTLIFDVTHGLRSLPFLVLLAAAYLKAAKQVTIEAIYYGAYELGQPAPIIDLSEFASLLDWLTAAERFIETGHGQPLANLLREQLPSDLAEAATAIEEVALALRVARPLETMAAAGRLEVILRQARDAVVARARPFALLAEQVRDAYAPFALADPLDRSHWAANLRLQLAMVRWYLDKGQVVQAATLTREWLVSLVAYRLGAASLVDWDGERSPIAGALNNARRRRQGKTIDRPSGRDADLEALPALDLLVEVWASVTNLRNDIAHMGMSECPRSASDLCRDMESIYPELARLAEALLEPQAGGEKAL